MYDQFGRWINGYPQQSGIVWGDAAMADSYPLAPNSAVAIWDRAQPLIYLKQADVTGRPSMRVLEYADRGQQQAAPAPATREDLAALASAIKELDGLIRQKEAPHE